MGNGLYYLQQDDTESAWRAYTWDDCDESSPSSPDTGYCSKECPCELGERDSKIIASLGSMLTIGVFVYAALGCNYGFVEETCDIINSTERALVNATRAPHFLHISIEQRGAIGLVKSDRTPRSHFCTATLIGPRWAITAAHCDRGGDMEFVFIQPNGTQAAVVVAEHLIPHPELDLLLVELSSETDQESVSIPWVTDSDVATLVGNPVLLAGFGETLNGPSKSLLFLTEQVVRVDEDKIVVDGVGQSGACTGDSGGPLLTRAVDGRIRIAGVLAKGDSSCTGVDEYIRLDRVNDWLRSLIGDAPIPASETCAGLSFLGECHGETAVWCEQERVQIDRCQNALLCGWSTSVEGYRCVADDPCEGIDSFGSCLDDTAMSCEKGIPNSVHCDDCDDICRRDPVTGKAKCL